MKGIKEIYESKIKDFPVKTLAENRNMDVIMANMSYNEKEYKTCRVLSNKILNSNNSKALELQINYMLAGIDEAEGNIEEAIRKYTKVANEGNQLYSSKLAKKKLKEYKIM